MSIFDKWNKAINTEELAKDVKEVEENGGTGEYAEVPVGNYEIKFEKMELTESSKGKPMFTAWMRILSGDFKNNLLFMNSVIEQGFQIGNVNTFLRNLEAVDVVEFKDYNQYNNLILDIAEAIDDQGLEYQVEYKKNKKDFPIYTIKEMYEK